MLEALLFLFCIICIYFAARYLNLVNYLKNIPVAKTRSAPQGYVELIGKARPVFTIKYYVPDIGLPCVWFECEYQVGAGDESQIVKKKD